MKREYYILALITLIGGYLRFYGLTTNPFWYDEAFFGTVIRNDIWRQEYINHFIAWLFNLNDDYSLRFVSALFGTLSIPAIYLVLKNYKWVGVLLVAFNPLFIFWSGMARPYATTGFLCILGWRWWWFYFPAVFNSSIFAAFAFRYNKWKILIPLVLIGLMFIIRPDAKTGNWFQYFWITVEAGRLWYLPIIGIILYLCDYILPRVNKKLVYAGVAGVMIFFLVPGQNWYRKDVYMFSDWRNCGKLDYATEEYNAEWYGGQDAKYFSHWGQKRIDSLLIAGDTLRVGIGQLGLGACAKFCYAYIGEPYKKYMSYIAQGNVIKLKLWARNNRLYHKLM